MNIKLTVEIDEKTAQVLEASAAELGVSVGELIAELAGEARAVGADEVAELDRRWASVEAVAHDKVVRWLDTWGSP